ncbi:hypothetical protein KEM56_000597 [Ascosphaera pollenicola]|nr:hypothetical protein KEM56_000597 [Ascosphaera pollenicola]
MVMELRKRKAPVQTAAAPADKSAVAAISNDKPAPAPAPAAKRQRRAKKPSKKQAQAKTTTAPMAVADAPKAGDKISLENFGGTIKRNDGSETTLQSLVNECNKGIVIFTYPKASTPGCTTQACLFRDSYNELTDAGFAVYGLSADSPNANTNFQTKQKLPYPLLCDPEQTLIGALGLKKTPKGTVRGVFMADKKGEVLLLQPGSPSATLDETKKVIASRREESKL